MLYRESPIDVEAFTAAMSTGARPPRHFAQQNVLPPKEVNVRDNVPFGTCYYAVVLKLVDRTEAGCNLHRQHIESLKTFGIIRGVFTYCFVFNVQ